MNAIELNLFSSRIEAVCDEMGAVLRRTAFSPNIRDRLDFSCAIFDANGELCAQAAHIPVHLGSMAYAMGGIVSRIEWRGGEMVVVNDPFLGGTHLPDVTVIAPMFVAGQLAAFVANRAHHADIGSDTPGR
jgi:N-methylhydantoinase B